METIIVPTDFSPAANNAVDYAVELARFFNARLVLLNAYPVPAANYEVGYSVEIISALHENAVEKLRNLKKDIEEKTGGGIHVECIAEMGAPFDVIESVAEDHDVDLIVLGIVGEAGKFKKNFIGSTAIDVARNLTTPTFIIPEKVRYRRIEKISLASDLERTEETDVIYVAKFFSKVFDAELEIVNVEKAEENITTEKAVTNLYVEQTLEHVKHKTIHIAGEDVAHDLEDYFRTYKTDLIMISPKKHNMFYYWFHDSVTKELAFHAGVPLLSIH